MKKNLINYLLFIVCVLWFTHSWAQTHKLGNVAIGGGGFVSAIITTKSEQNLVYARTDVGGAYKWNETTKLWTPLTDWVSEDETTYLGVESMAIDPQIPSRLYMLVGISYFNGGKTAILKSNDYGNTFQEIQVTNQFRAHGNGMGRQTGEKLVVDPNNSNVLYCGTRWNGLFKSTNAGLNWSRLTGLNVTTTPNENGVSFVVLNPSSASGGSTQTMFVGISRYGSNLYRSTNGGTSFTEITGGPNRSNLMPHRAVLASDGNLYITFANGAGPHGHWDAGLNEPMDQGQVWKYNTSTGVWTNITPSSTRAYGGLSVDPNNPNRVIVSTINQYSGQYQHQGSTVWGDRIYLSTNGGTSWTDIVNGNINLNANGVTWINGHSIHWAGSVEFDPFNSARAWVTSGNGIFRCENVNTAPTTWVVQVNGLEETVPLDMVSLPGGALMSVIGDYDGFKHTDITQYAPIHTPRMGTTTGIAYAANNINKLVRVGNQMYYTTNQGTSWTQTSSMNGQKGRVALSADGNTLLHNPENSSTMYRSTNNGGSWSTVSGLSINNAAPVADPVNSSKFYAYNSSNGIMYVSTNGGTSFSASGSAGTGGSRNVRTVPGREGHLWIAMYNGGLKRSTNSGASFTTINGVSYCAAVGIGKANAGASYETIYIWGTVNNVRGLFYSTNEGSSWTRMNDDEHEWGGPGNGQFVIGDMNTFGRVYMSTAGRGVVYAEITTGACTPPAAPTINTPVSYCQGAVATPLTATGAALKWYGTNATGGSASTSAPTPATGAVGATTYYVSQTVNTCESARAAIVVNVSAAPVITPYTQSDGVNWVQTSTAQVCSGTTVSFGPQPNTATGWSWTGPNNFTAASREIVIADVNTAKSGTYIATYNNGTCSATANFTISLHPNPTATIAAGASSFCQGQNMVLNANTGTGLSYVWRNGITQVGTNTASYTANAAGSYTVEVTNSNGCKATSTARVLTVTSPTIWYADTDNDGSGDPNTTQTACLQPTGYVANNNDQCPSDANKIAPGNCGCGNTEQSCIDCNGIVNGTATIDNCAICTGGLTGRTACTGKIEAELVCVVDGVSLESTNAGYTGNGYVNTTNVMGASALWELESASAGQVTLGFRYASGGTANRDATLIINGVSVGTIGFPPTGAFTIWLTTATNVTLKAGSNVVELLALSDGGLPNIDYISHSGAVTMGDCIITGVDSKVLNSHIYLYPNPASTAVLLEGVSNKEWILYNMVGVEVLRGSEVQLDISGLSSGVYHLYVEGQVIKLLKE